MTLRFTFITTENINCIIKTTKISYKPVFARFFLPNIMTLGLTNSHSSNIPGL